MNKDIDIDFASSACFDDNIYILFYSWKSAHKLPPICITHTGFCVSPHDLDISTVIHTILFWTITGNVSPDGLLFPTVAASLGV